LGPYAGLDTYRMLLNSVNADRDQDHYPLIVASIPHEIADRSEYVLGITDENPGFAIQRQILKLYDLGCRVIGVACNTAHSKIIWEVIENGINKYDDLVLINMIEETFKIISNDSEQPNVLLLATLGTYHANTFQEYAMNFNVNLVCPSIDNQHMLHNVIYEKKSGIKSMGTMNSMNTKKVNNLVRAELEKNRGITGIILGCTELSMVSASVNMQGRMLYKTNSILANSLLEKFNLIKNQVH